MKQVRIATEAVELLAELGDTPTARALLKALPCESTARTWGDEVYLAGRPAGSEDERDRGLTVRQAN